MQLKNQTSGSKTVFGLSIVLTLFSIGGGGRQNGSPTSFFPVTSTNVGISPQNFLTFNFNHLSHWCKISRPYLVPVPNHWSWTKTTPQKKWYFWSNPYKIEVMITSLIEMLELRLVTWTNLQYNMNHVTKFSLWRHRQE